MKEIEFDLLTEPWIRVRLKDNTVQEVSLTEALVSAQDYVDLAGEMPTQDAAVLRLLLAVLFTVFSPRECRRRARTFGKKRSGVAEMERAVAAGAFPGRTYPGLSGTVEGPLLALPPDAPLLAGADSLQWYCIRWEKVEWGTCGERQ